ncbi:MAG: caspase family protein [Elusimicrobia bacterium]|nr:caspase family protein [Elusimicrobiota bacterium]
MLGADAPLGAVRLWSLATGTLQAAPRYPSAVFPVRALAFTGDGKKLLAAFNDGFIQAWDLPDLAEASSWQEGRGFSAIAFSPDGRKLLVSSKMGIIELRDSFDGRQLGSWRTGSPPAVVRALAFCGDGKRFVSTSESISFWRIDAQEPVAVSFEPKGGSKGKGPQSRPSDAITSAACSSDARFALTGHADGMVRLWDDVKGNELKTWDTTVFGKPTNVRFSPEDAWKNVNQVYFLPDSRGIVMARIGGIKTWDRSVPALLGESGLARPPDPRAFAVVIGVGGYSSGLQRSDYAAQDAVAMRDLLVTRLGFPADNVALLVDDHATLADFSKYLDAWMKNRVPQDGRVIVYFAGRGMREPASGEAFLLSNDSDPAYPEETAYPLRTLLARLEELPARTSTLILDACFCGTGPRSAQAPGVRPLVTKNWTAPDLKRTIMLSAARMRQCCAIEPRSGHGLFTQAILEGLGSATAPETDPAGDVEGLYDYASKRVVAASADRGSPQEPEIRPSLAALRSRKMAVPPAPNPKGGD